MNNVNGLPNQDLLNAQLYQPSSPSGWSPYGYYATPTFPYIIGCDGPGVYSTEELALSAPELLAQTTGSKLASCPAGYMMSQAFENGCLPCPAEKYSVTSPTLIEHILFIFKNTHSYTYVYT